MNSESQQLPVELWQMAAGVALDSKPDRLTMYVRETGRMFSMTGIAAWCKWVSASPGMIWGFLGGEGVVGAWSGVVVGGAGGDLAGYRGG